MMYYIDALRLVRLAVEHGVLTEHTQIAPETGGSTTGLIVCIQGKEEPELWTEEYMARKLMDDREGEKILIRALSEKGVAFTHFEGSSLNNILNATCESTQVKE